MSFVSPFCFEDFKQHTFWYVAMIEFPLNK